MLQSDAWQSLHHAKLVIWAMLCVPMPAPLPASASGVTPLEIQAFGVTRKGVPVTLPPGIVDLEMWGRSVLEFGKYVSHGWTYKEMITSQDPEVRSYVKWCRGQVDNADGFRKDFGMYILASEFKPDQGLIIPGTCHTRKLR